MRWTAENDAVLFSLVLSTHNVTVDGSAVAKVWPTEEGEERPTPRAITERIFKIRKNAGHTNSGGASGGKVIGNSSKDASVPVSAPPRAKKVAGAKQSAATTKQTMKDFIKPSRKRKESTVLETTETSEAEDDEEEEEQLPTTPPKKKSKTKHTVIKTEPAEEEKYNPAASFPYSPAATTPGNDGVYGYDAGAGTMGNIYDALDNDAFDFNSMDYGGGMSSSLG